MPRWSIFFCLRPAFAASSWYFSKLGRLPRGHRGLPEDATLVVDRADKAVERAHRHGGIPAPWLHAHAGAEPRDAVGGRLRKPFGHSHDLRLGQQGDLFRPLGCPVLDLQVPPLHQAVGVLLLEGGLVHRLTCHEAVLAVGEIAHELAAPEALGQDDMGHGRGQGPVLARLHGEPLVGLAPRGAEPGVHHREGPLVQKIPESADGVGDHPVGGDRVRSPDQHILGLFQIEIVISEQAVGVEPAELLRLGAERAVGDVVGRAEDLRHGIVQKIVQVGIPPAEEDEFVRLVVPPQLQHLVGDRTHRLVPRDGNEARVLGPPFLGVGPLHGDLDPVRVVHLLQNEVTSGAHMTVVRFGALIPPDLHRSSVLDEDLDRAPGRAAFARRGHPLSGRRGAGPDLVIGAVGEGVEHRSAERRSCSGRQGGLEEFPSLDLHASPPFFARSSARRPRLPVCVPGSRQQKKTHPRKRGMGLLCQFIPPAAGIGQAPGLPREPSSPTPPRGTGRIGERLCARNYSGLSGRCLSGKVRKIMGGLSGEP